MSMIVTVTLSGTAISYYVPSDSVEKRYISTQLDRHISPKFNDHRLFRLFMKYFIEFIEEHKSLKDVPVWNSSINYIVDDVVQWSGRFYKCIADNSGISVDDVSFWSPIFYNTAGVYEHINNFSRYMNIDAIIDDFRITDRFDLYDFIIEAMVDESVYDKKIYKDAGGLRYQDLVFMIKRFNTEKLTNKPFIRAVNYLRNANPLASVEFAETRSEMITKLSWSNTTEYSIGQAVIYGTTYSYRSLQDHNIGMQPDLYPAYWEQMPKHMILDDSMDIPMEYGDRFRYFINSNDFRINSLMMMCHPAGYIADIVYFPVYKEQIIVPAIGYIVQAVGTGEVSGVFDYST